MKTRLTAAFLVLMLLALTACGQGHNPTEPPLLEQTEIPATSEPAPAATQATEPVATQPPPTAPAHSALYLPDISVEDVIVYFNEVCLDGEFINSGDPSYVQKWANPIRYTLEGSYTEQDLSVLHDFEAWLNSMDGFPGICAAEEPELRNLRICFCTPEEMVTLMGPNFENMDGAVTFWYNYDEIYDAIICCRTDLDQELRNSVLLEEIYNGLGPIQDTVLRLDSIIYQELSQNQCLSPMDELILKLLYHPDMLPGMDAQQCEQVIRNLYY